LLLIAHPLWYKACIMLHQISSKAAFFFAAFGLAGFFTLSAHAWQSDNGNGTFNNPVLYADYPDPDIIRVSNDFYMVSTTFSDSPGINVLHSRDLVNWEIVSHVATNLNGGNAYNMIGGTAYRAGFWASSIRYYNGTFYVVANPSFSNSRIYYTTNIAGPWQYYQLNQVTYDPGLFIETNGAGYIVAGHGPQSVFVLNSTFSSIVAVSNNVLNSGAEGTHVVKRGNYYFAFNAKPSVWPYQLLCSRATNIFGPYETNHVCLTETTGGHQGAIVDMPDGSDYGFVMKDSGAIGRMTYICPITWSNNWPVWGTVPARATKPITGEAIMQPATSDEFTNATLGLQWQWNHNPDNTKWSLSARAGYLRLMPAAAKNFWVARNTLTQKGQGPWSRGDVKLDISHMQPGDICGFGTLGLTNGQIAVTCDGWGNRFLSMNVISPADSTGTNVTQASFGRVLTNVTNLFLRVDLDFVTTLGTCFYSFDGSNWTRLGGQFGLGFDISVSTFQGEKFAIFCYNANPGSGYVDVDWFHFSDKYIRGRPRLTRSTFVADNGQLLRGPFTSTEWTGPAPAQNIANLRTMGFNAVHLYGENFNTNYPNGGSVPGYSMANIDSIVASTRTNGLYLVLTIGNGAYNGMYNSAYITNFWALYAARYANETHVLFEIQNEPVAWGPPYSAANATPPGAVNMEIAAYNVIRANAPDTPVLVFSYAVFGGSGGASSAMTDIRAFNTAVFGNANAVWTNLAVGFHGYAGADNTASAVSALISSGYPCFMTEFAGSTWGYTGGSLDIDLTTELERQGASWLTFQHVPPDGVSDNIAEAIRYKNPVDNSGLSWASDYGNWPQVRGPYGNSGQARTISASYANNFLTGTALRIQAEDFDTGGEGVAYHELTSTNLSGQYRTNEVVDIEVTADTGGGYDVTSTDDGEWLEYTIKATVAGYYNISLRYATPSNDCAVSVAAYGQDRTGTWTLPSTGGYSTWATVTRPILLVDGRQKLTINILNGGFNLNWIELTPASTGFVPNGTYKFLNAASGFAITGLTNTNGTVAVSYTNAAVQQWTLQHVGGNQYRVSSVANGYNWNINSGGSLTLSSGWGTGGNQCFILAPTSAGFCSILPVGNGVSVETASSTSTVIDQKIYSGSANQQWVLAAPDAPMFPTGLSATETSPTQVFLTWTAVTGADNYTVKRSPASGGPYTVIASGVTSTSYADTVPAGMRYYYVVTAVAEGAESPNSPEAAINVFYPWATQDIGSVGVAGSARFSSGVFSVTGAGADIWGTADAFRFVYVPITGNCTLIARVVSVQNIDAWSKAGLMIRESLAANAMNAYIAVTPGNGVTWQYRTSAGGSTANNNTTGLNAPYWVKLVRNGNSFSGYRSADGTNWTQQGSTNSISMSSTVLAGLALTSHNGSSLCTAIFDNVTVPGWSNSLPPQAPSGLAASAANWQVNLQWRASSNAASYNVKRAYVNGGPYTILTNVTSTNFTDSALVNGTNHYYVVSALNSAGESANSDAAVVLAQVFAPSGLSATPVSYTQVSLVWNAFTNATSYNVKFATNSGGPYVALASGVTMTNFTDTVAVGQKRYYIVSAISGGIETPNSAEAIIKLPYPWRTQDIGTVGVAGDADFINSIFSITASGADIWDTADGFRFVYMTLTGDCTVIARVTGVQNVNAWSKAGIMFRESLASNAVNAFIAVTPGNGVTWQYRSSTGGSSANSATSSLNAPYWVKLVHSGNSFSGYRSPDGTNWTQQGSTVTLTLSSSVLVGLAVTSHALSTPCNATFDNVTTPNWPVALPPAPDVPTNLVALAGDAQVNLSWSAPTGAVSYNVKRSLANGGPYNVITNVTTPKYTDAGLSNGFAYYYVVSALNTSGEGDNSAQVSAKPLASPRLSVTLEDTNLVFAWPLPTRFSLQSCTNLNLGTWEIISNVTLRPSNGLWQVSLPLPMGSNSIYYRLMK
jgi:endoglucanase